MFSENVFNISLVKKCLDFLVGESTFRKSLACVTIECGSVSGGENGPFLGWRLLDTTMAAKRTASLSRELCVLPFLCFAEHAQRAAVEVDIVPEESIAAVVTSVTSDFGTATTRECEHAHERAVA